MKNIGIILVVLVVLGGGYMLMQGKNTQAPVENAMPAAGASGVEEAVVTEQVTGASGAMMEKSDAKEFTLDSFEFGYSEKTLTVKKGDTVKITLTNSGKMMHDWIVDEFTGAKTKQITNGLTDTVTFVADKAGTFEYYCSVGKHRANGMVGKLIVE